MSHHCATLQSAFEKTASVLDFAYTVADSLYWLDDHYVQPFYSWAAPRLREAAISGIYWALVTLIDVSLCLIDTTRQFFARDAHAITLYAFAQDHEPLPELPALPPAAVPLALPSVAIAMAVPSPVLQGESVPEGLDDETPVLVLCPATMPMTLSSFVPDDSVRRWLSSALPLVIAPGASESLTVPVCPAVAPVVTDVSEAAPVLKKARQSAKASGRTAKDKTPRKRSPKTIATTQ